MAVYIKILIKLYGTNISIFTMGERAEWLLTPPHENSNMCTKSMYMYMHFCSLMFVYGLASWVVFAT